MKKPGSRYLSLWVLALAFGWIEASVVVYLREIGMRESAMPHGSLANVPVTLAWLPGPLVSMEVAREACTLILLAAAAWLAGRRLADRLGAFLVLFGIWDLTYYVVLWLVIGWPPSLRTWDILFLIPVPWAAPVWAPATVAALFVLGGSYLFQTPDRRRRYRWTDAGILLASVCLILGAFLARWRLVMDERPLRGFPIWVFWSGVALGAAWFARVERRWGG
jgi:hypothetical protein